LDFFWRQTVGVPGFFISGFYDAKKTAEIFIDNEHKLGLPPAKK
jgi:hypothetical protein